MRLDTGGGRSYTKVGAAGAAHRPTRWAVVLEIEAEQPVEFGLKLRLPWWLAGDATLAVNGEHTAFRSRASSFQAVRRTWSKDTVRLELPMALAACPLPDEPDTVAFMEGPAVLAGLCDEQRMLYGDKSRPADILTPHNEREWTVFLPTYRTRRQPRGLRFKPLHQVTDEPYTVYFPIQPPH